MSEVVEVPAAPGIGSVYRHAALGQLRHRSSTELPGTTLVLRGLSVDRAHLAAYDRVCGYRLSDQLCPTYPHILAFPLAMRLMSAVDFPVRVIGVVHIANRIEVLRPIDAGERLEFTVRATDLRPHERGRQFDVRTTASVDDEVVWRGISTYLRREKARDDPAPRDTAQRERVPRPPAPRPTAVWRVGRDVGTRYAKVSGDHNPIHTSRLGARVFGFPRTIAHGMWSMARCLAALEGRLPDSYAVDVAFKLPILLPASVGFSAERDDDGWAIGLHDARSGKPHLTGHVTG
ncbi:MaoC/PaaZ C-terminal domain-containing protein [Rugosimonospora acidiphila]|uniref:MaoC/PaaZ C-terminal domain-containing protein n=1 Tax=Rugosimonospora acidiphila TaxID=556531 RepID=A0ABP9RG53_9ACTN